MSEEINTAEIGEIWTRIARTADGQIAYRWLQGVLMSKADKTDMSALPFLEGRRSLAWDIAHHMAQGIADSDRYAITFVTRVTPRDERATRGAGRRITAGSFVPGYDIDRTGVPYDTGGNNGSGSGTAG
jgi:hypothetical protein